MCDGHDDGHAQVAASAPRSADGVAVDPIELQSVDELRIRMLVDNSYDGLMVDMPPARRAPMGRTPPVDAEQFVQGTTVPGLVAEHGFSALVTVRRGDHSHTVLFDAGVSPGGLVGNMDRLGVDPTDIEAVVLSHGHFDHAGGLVGLKRRLPGQRLPMLLHPLVWSPRRVALPGLPPWELPALSRRAIESEGFEVVERRQPSLLLDGCLLVTGEVDRTTEFERGMASHERFDGQRWEPDPLILDDQALVVNVRDLGLVVLTGCGHAGAVNIVRHAMRLTGVDRLHGLLGGFHLTGPGFEPLIAPTVSALSALEPGLVVPAHCTGWRANLALANSFTDAYVPNAVGTEFVLA